MTTQQQYGRWVALRAAPNKGRERMQWCRCACGAERAVSLRALKAGRSLSCGCLKAEMTGVRSRTHGRSETLLYRAWRGMIERCESPAHKSYAYYGGRGITVCARWHAFENFLADMGERPAGHSLERRENDKGYGPDNCYWATRKEQMANIRTTRQFTVHEVTRTAKEWAAILGISLHGLITRVDVYKWDIARACTTPHQRKHKE